MKLPRNYFENLSASKYREYLKILPNMKKENTKAITMLIFTLVGLSFLGIFAISPTLSTIIELKKQVEDSTFVHDKLTTKLNNLSNLQQQYDLIQDDLPYVFDAIPKSAAASPFIGQTEAIAQRSNIKLNSIRVEKVDLAGNKKMPNSTTQFNFLLEAEGSHESLMGFASSLSSFNRIITFESVALAKDQRRGVLVLTIKGRGYFKR